MCQCDSYKIHQQKLDSNYFAYIINANEIIDIINKQSNYSSKNYTPLGS